MAVAAKAPAPGDFAGRAGRLRQIYRGWLADAEQGIPPGRKLRRRMAQLYRSKGERRAIADYYRAHFVVDPEPAASLAKVG